MTVKEPSCGMKRILEDETLSRGRRMMDMLRGTLAKPSSNLVSEAALKKKEELERKLAEKLAAEKKLLEEEAEKIAKDKNATRMERIQEQEKLFREKINQRRLREAKFLGTKTEPKLFWLPKILMEEDEKIVKEHCQLDNP